MDPFGKFWRGRAGTNRRGSTNDVEELQQISLLLPWQGPPIKPSVFINSFQIHGNLPFLAMWGVGERERLGMHARCLQYVTSRASTSEFRCTLAHSKLMFNFWSHLSSYRMQAVGDKDYRTSLSSLDLYIVYPLYSVCTIKIRLSKNQPGICIHHPTEGCAQQQVSLS